MSYSPMYQDVSVSQAGGVYEVVAQAEVLRQVLIRGVRCHYAKVVLVLEAKREFNIKKGQELHCHQHMFIQYNRRQLSLPKIQKSPENFTLFVTC